MLLSLQISNYALIDTLDIEFNKGLTTITGETGAGKSILLGALSLILGARSDTQVLKNKELKCVVEGCFDHPDKLLKAIFAENDLETDGFLILRREISPNGKSRAFVNDTPVNLPVLKEIGLKLVDIHSQHENLELNNNLYQLMVVDSYAGLHKMVEEYHADYTVMRKLFHELAGIREKARSSKAELDFLTFQFNELENVRLKEGELEELETELEILEHAGEIKSGLFTTWNNIAGDGNNVISLLKLAEADLLKIKNIHKPSEQLQERIESIIIDLKDIAAEAELHNEKTALDPARLQEVEARLNMIYSLLQKHRQKTVEELISLKNEWEAQISKLGLLEFRMEELERELNLKRELVTEKAKCISVSRENIFPELGERIVTILVQLGIPHAQFRIINEKNSEPGEHGFDNIKFLFTANRKTDLQDISRIASGGEISRLMLCIKYIVSGSTGLPTIIFDEIDSGVSGEIAYKVGAIMKEMSSVRQVFAISHLPQVAAKGMHHYFVFKEETDKGTTTRIRILNSDERIAEVARMLSGEQTTLAALANAKELLGVG